MIFYERNDIQPKAFSLKPKKTQACKPGSVFHSIIYLGLLLPTASCSLPLTSFIRHLADETRTGSPVSANWRKTQYIWPYNP